MKTIEKSGAIILNENCQMLIVHKRDKPKNEFIVPGGKIEQGETRESALLRELKEELSVEIDAKSVRLYNSFEAKAIYDDLWLIMHVYHVKLKNEPIPSGEIDYFEWVGKDFNSHGFVYASILGKQLLPKLADEGLIK